MSTFSDIIEEVSSKLEGGAMTGDRVTWLASAMDVDDTVVSVDDAAGFSRGLVEVDLELMYVSGYDTVGQTFTLAPWGRGQKGTAATVHNTSARVAMAPTWPRSSIANEINNQINLLYPTLFSTAAATFTADGQTYQFDIDVSAERVVDVRWLYTSIDGWQRSTYWETDNTPAIGDVMAGARVSVYDVIPPGSTIQVVYATRPTNLFSLTDDFALVTGLPITAKDLVVLGTIATMAQFMDVARLPTLTVETDSQSGAKPLGTAFQVAGQLRQQYAQRLAQEQSALYQRYPLRKHRTR